MNHFFIIFGILLGGYSLKRRWEAGGFLGYIEWRIIATHEKIFILTLGLCSILCFIYSFIA